jgi:prepilin-type N-terminal cleavage/methylation domain-containing protein
MKQREEKQQGFTLIELMIVVAIIAILAAFAVPNFVRYRNRAFVATAVATGESLRTAMSAYASDSIGNLFPVGGWEDGPAGWDDLRSFMIPLGTSLKQNMREQGFRDFIYRTIESDGEDGADYFFIFQTVGTPPDQPGALLEVRPSGIDRWTGTL